MKAVDTNVIIRLLTGDDPHQSLVAQRVVEDDVVVTHSVLMEAEWVLRGTYGWSRLEIAESFEELLTVDTIHVPQEEAVLWALDRYRSGADWADMLHLLAARGTRCFSTFDRSIARDAGAPPPLPIEILK